MVGADYPVWSTLPSSDCGSPVSYTRMYTGLFLYHGSRVTILPGDIPLVPIGSFFPMNVFHPLGPPLSRNDPVPIFRSPPLVVGKPLWLCATCPRLFPFPACCDTPGPVFSAQAGPPGCTQSKSRANWEFTFLSQNLRDQSKPKEMICGLPRGTRFDCPVKRGAPKVPK